LQIPATRLNLSPNLRRLFLYFSETILKRLTNPMACSLATRPLEILRFRRLSSSVKGLRLERFFGNSVFACIFTIPWYPVSVLTATSGAMRTPDSLKSLKSCRFPSVNAVHIIFRLSPHTTTCVFTVCLFFLPEQNLRCFFEGVRSGFLWRPQARHHNRQSLSPTPFFRAG